MVQMNLKHCWTSKKLDREDSKFEPSTCAGNVAINISPKKGFRHLNLSSGYHNSIEHQLANNVTVHGLNCLTVGDTQLVLESCPQGKKIHQMYYLRTSVPAKVNPHHLSHLLGPQHHQTSSGLLH